MIKTTKFRLSWGNNLIHLIFVTVSITSDIFNVVCSRTFGGAVVTVAPLTTASQVRALAACDISFTFLTADAWWFALRGFLLPSEGL